jgi:hypothetical protein
MVVNAQMLTHSIPKPARELRASIGDDVVRDAVLADNFLEEHSR